MKCIQKKRDIRRVSDDEASKLVKEDGYKYIPRHVWKEQVRDNK